MKKANKKPLTAMRVIPFLLTIVFAVSLTACKPKEPITAEVFKEKLEGQGYTVTDISDEYPDSEHMVRVLSAEKDSLRIDFAEIDKTDTATAVFNGNKASVEAYKGNGSVESSYSAGNHQKYALTTSDTQYTVVRVEATIIYSYCDKSEKDVLDNLIKELGY